MGGSQMFITKNRRRIIAIASLVLVSAYTTGASETLKCGLCTTVNDYMSCWSQAFEYHLFNGLTAYNGYDGYHANAVCGDCSSSHISCGTAAIQAADAFYAAAKQSDSELVRTAAEHPKYISVNVDQSTAELKDCSSHRVALIEIPAGAATVVASVL